MMCGWELVKEKEKGCLKKRKNLKKKKNMHWRGELSLVIDYLCRANADYGSANLKHKSTNNDYNETDKKYFHCCIYNARGNMHC